MDYLKLDGQRLPTVTLIGRDIAAHLHKNIRRVSEDYILYVITKGEMSFCEDGREYHLKKGDCFLFEPKKLHFGTENSLYNLVFIHFADAPTGYATPADGNAAVDPLSVCLPKRLALSEDALSAVCFAADKAIKSRKEQAPCADTLCALQVSEAFVAICRDYKSVGRRSRGMSGLQRINEVMAYLGENYKRRLTGEIIEKELSYNFDYLNQQFRQHMHMSIFKMLQKIRMDESKILLQTTTDTVGAISDAVGYDDAAYFSRCFKKLTGYTPLEYRKKQIG